MQTACVDTKTAGQNNKTFIVMQYYVYLLLFLTSNIYITSVRVDDNS